VITKMGKKLRRAAVAVEMAVVTPVLLTMLFGIIEFGWLFTVRHTMVNAAREGARLGSLAGATSGDAQVRALEMLETLNIDDDCTVAVTAATEDDPMVTVRISVPRASVSLVGTFFNMTSGTIEGEASMRKEGL
jgi:Flp pilus assembly protein TadG